MSKLFHYLFYQPILNIMILIVALLPGHSLGWGIILMTLMIRLLLYSSSLSTIKNSQKLQKIQPEIKRIQKLYQNDRQKQTEELLRLYKENKVNPYGSCLPLIIQLAVLIALYSVLRGPWPQLPKQDLYSFIPQPQNVAISFYGYNLLERPRLSFPFTSSAAVYVLIAVLSAFFQFYQTKMLMPKQKASSDTQAMLNQNMLYLTPLFTLYIGLTLPPALPLYWLINSLFSVAQQYWFIHRGHIDLTPSSEESKSEVKKEEPKVKEAPKVMIEKKGDVTLKVRRKD